MARTLLVVLFVAVAAGARPPASDSYQRMDELRADLGARYKQLKEQEEFERKPLEEKLAILLDRADPKARPTKFERIEITPSKVAKKILEWEELRTDTPSDAAKNTLAVLHEALKKRYGDPAIVDFDRNPRHNASPRLVDETVSDHLWLRTACFDIRRTIYRNPNGLFYRPDAADKARKEKKAEWGSYIRKERRR